MSLTFAFAHERYWALVEQIPNHVAGGLHERVFGGAGAGRLRGDAERHELADAVLDVEPHAPERLHQRLDFERLVWTRAQEPQQPGPQRRLHERVEARLDLGGIDPPA